MSALKEQFIGKWDRKVSDLADQTRMVDYEKLRIQIRDMVETVYEELKRESKDYGELKKKCEKYHIGLGHRDNELGLYAKKIFDAKLEYELRNITIE